MSAQGEVERRVEVLVPGALGATVMRGHDVLTGHLCSTRAAAETVADGAQAAGGSLASAVVTIWSSVAGSAASTPPTPSATCT